MCGRYYRRSDKQRIAEAFRLGELPDDFVLPPNFTLRRRRFSRSLGRTATLGQGTGDEAPGPGTVFREVAGRLQGLLNHQRQGGNRETVQDNAMWRGLLERRRCLVPADGFYEWMKLDAKTKKPYAFAMRDTLPFAFAGLWDAWRNAATNDWLQSFSVITTEPNELRVEGHTRMPVILHARDYERWLDRDERERRRLTYCPYEADTMTASACNQPEGNPPQQRARRNPM